MKNNSVIQIALEPENISEIPKLINGLKELIKSDPLIDFTINSYGQYIIATETEVHLEICLQNLTQNFCKNIKIKTSKPFIKYMETVSEKCEACLALTPNRHNKLYFEAEPLNEEIIKLIENNNFVEPTNDLNDKKDNNILKENCKRLMELHLESNKNKNSIWSFGPKEKGPNILVNMCNKSNGDYLNEIKDYVISAFQQTSLEGALCSEEMRGIRFNLINVQLHSDTIHRGAGKIIPASYKGMKASQLRAKSKLMEPIYFVKINECLKEEEEIIKEIIMKRKGIIIEIEKLNEIYLLIKCFVPVVESFGLEKELKSKMKGKERLLIQCVFDHWKVIDEDVMDKNSKLNKLVKEIRKRKGDKEEVPNYIDFLDNNK